MHDKLTNIEFVRSALEPFHYRIIAAANIQEAVRLAVSDVPDLIFTDLHMPGQDGDDFVRMIKTKQLLKEIPIVIFTSSFSFTESISSDCHTLHCANALISRPIEPQELLALVETTLKIETTQSRAKALTRI